MNKLLAILLGSLLLAILGYFCVYKLSPLIQKDIDTRVHATFSEHDIDHITVATNGRDITLSGEVKNEEARRQAEEYASSTNGVRTVDNQITIATEVESVVEKEENSATK